MVNAKKLMQKIKRKEARVGVIGIGYIGSALSYGASDAGCTVIGFDVDSRRIREVNRQRNPRFSASSDFSALPGCDIVCICVPTPLDERKNPDLSILVAAVKTTTRYLRKGQLVIIESSVSPGTTRTLLLPILKQSSLVLGKDFFVSFSPERIDPGNRVHSVKTIPKVVSGYDAQSLKLALEFYGLFVDSVVPVSSFEVAEMTKTLENVFRLVNISLINEIAGYVKKLGIDMWEVISAAGTKPFGFMPHFPGPGAGGSCIPVLPRYLLADAKKSAYPLTIIEQAWKFNEKQPVYVAKKAYSLLSRSPAAQRNRRVLLIGVAYKEGNSDTRESPALKIWRYLRNKNVSFSYHDPYVPEWNGLCSVELEKTVLDVQDLIIILTAHKTIDFDLLVESGKPILDTRNVLVGVNNTAIHRL